MNNFQITKNFNLREFESPDTHEVKISKELVEKLQEVRDILGFPIYVTSGYRTFEHNQIVGGVNGSSHVEGFAADVTVKDLSLRILYIVCLSCGFEKVIEYKKENFLHLQIKRG